MTSSPSSPFYYSSSSSPSLCRHSTQHISRPFITVSIHVTQKLPKDGIPYSIILYIRVETAADLGLFLRTTTTTDDTFSTMTMRRPSLLLSRSGVTAFGAPLLQSALFLLLLAGPFVSIVQGLSNTTPLPTTTAASSISKFAYRMAKPADVPAIAQLLTDAFENCDNDTDTTDRAVTAASTVTTKKEIEQMLQQRMIDVQNTSSSSSLPHAFLVATKTTTTNKAVAADHGIAAFLELGTMPSPIVMERIWNGVPISTRPELPFVANLVVDPSTRRQKVGYTLLQLAIKIGKKWCDNNENNNKNAFLFLSVDRGNEGALAFYERLDFERIELSSSSTSSSSDNSAAPSSASKVYLKKPLFT